MAYQVGRSIALPLLLLNSVMYFVVLGFASWCLNKSINGQSNHHSFGGNGATIFFLVFALLAAVLGIVSKFAGGNHLLARSKDSQAAAGSLSLVSWAVTALAFGLACKEINMGGHRGWRIRVVEAFIIILAFTQLLYVLVLHSGVFSMNYGTYYDTDFGLPGPTHKDPALSAGTAPTLVE